MQKNTPTSQPSAPSTNLDQTNIASLDGLDWSRTPGTPVGTGSLYYLADVASTLGNPVRQSENDLGSPFAPRLFSPNTRGSLQPEEVDWAYRLWGFATRGEQPLERYYCTRYGCEEQVEAGAHHPDYQASSSQEKVAPYSLFQAVRPLPAAFNETPTASPSRVSHLDMPSNHADRPTEGQNDTPRSLDLSVIDPELLAMSGTLPDDERDEEQTEGDDSRILVSTFIHPDAPGWNWPTEAAVAALLVREPTDGKTKSSPLLSKFTSYFPQSQRPVRLANRRLQCNAGARIQDGQWKVWYCDRPTFGHSFDFRKHLKTLHLGDQRQEDWAKANRGTGASVSGKKKGSKRFGKKRARKSGGQDGENDFDPKSKRHRRR
ncbi:hypothetical protein M408DRAFT_27489 [Serendipita vermifera MAFF 305830]|uniref:Uncharacterized protein n=1 Tax=Serendipita vermifera MAFF 305830 TaxID=933852 RepID=A0A0C3AXA1_SERVB|nr:hypothetical protein M408DRAFT_27489 [Serendipita vermifera MAFF 305830]